MFMSVDSTYMPAFDSNYYYNRPSTLSNIMQQKEIHLIFKSAKDNAANTRTLEIKSHNIRSLCVRHDLEPFKHI